MSTLHSIPWCLTLKKTVRGRAGEVVPKWGYMTKKNVREQEIKVNNTTERTRGGHGGE